MVTAPLPALPPRREAVSADAVEQAYAELRREIEALEASLRDTDAATRALADAGAAVDPDEATSTLRRALDELLAEADEQCARLLADAHAEAGELLLAAAHDAADTVQSARPKPATVLAGPAPAEQAIVEPALVAPHQAAERGLDDPLAANPLPPNPLPADVFAIDLRDDEPTVGWQPSRPTVRTSPVMPLAPAAAPATLVLASLVAPRSQPTATSPAVDVPAHTEVTTDDPAEDLAADPAADQEDTAPDAHEAFWQEAWAPDPVRQRLRLPLYVAMQLLAVVLLLLIILLFFR